MTLQFKLPGQHSQLIQHGTTLYKFKVSLKYGQNLPCDGQHVHLQLEQAIRAVLAGILSEKVLHEIKTNDFIFNLSYVPWKVGKMLTFKRNNKVLRVHPDMMVVTMTRAMTVHAPDTLMEQTQVRAGTSYESKYSHSSDDVDNIDVERTHQSKPRVTVNIRSAQGSASPDGDPSMSSQSIISQYNFRKRKKTLSYEKRSRKSKTISSPSVRQSPIGNTYLRKSDTSPYNLRKHRNTFSFNEKEIKAGDIHSNSVQPRSGHTYYLRKLNNTPQRSYSVRNKQYVLRKNKISKLSSPANIISVGRNSTAQEIINSEKNQPPKSFKFNTQASVVIKGNNQSNSIKQCCNTRPTQGPPLVEHFRRTPNTLPYKKTSHKINRKLPLLFQSVSSNCQVNRDRHVIEEEELGEFIRFQQFAKTSLESSTSDTNVIPSSPPRENNRSSFLGNIVSAMITPFKSMFGSK